jgi:hypothetical protein
MAATRLVSQLVGVALIPRSQAQVLLKLSLMGFPRPTWGVQRTVWHVSEMLQEHNPHLRPSRISMGASKQDPAHTCERSGPRGSGNPSSV